MPAGLGMDAALPSIATGAAAVADAPRLATGDTRATGDTPRQRYDPSGDGDGDAGGANGDRAAGDSPRSTSDSDDAETMHR